MLYGYVRVSTDYQDYVSQKAVIERRFKIDRWFEDMGTGRKIQPNLAQLVELAKDGDEIVVYAFDRLGRNMKAVLEVADILQKKGVKLISCREAMDLSSPIGTMLFQLLGSIAEFESRLIGDRVKQGMKAAKARGLRISRPRLEEYPEKARAIEYAKVLRAEGLYIKDIRKILLDELGIKISKTAIHEKIRHIKTKGAI